MRGENSTQGHMFTYLLPEQRVPKDHPLRAIKESCQRECNTDPLWELNFDPPPAQEGIDGA
jgi:hypothetical protein